MKEKKVKRICNNIRQLIYILIIIVSLVSISIYIFNSNNQKNVSVEENRNLIVNENLKTTLLSDGTFQSVIEDLLTDQFIFRNDFVTIKNQIDQKILSLFIDVNEANSKLNPIADGSKYQIGFSNYLMYGPVTYDSIIEERIINRINDINELASDYSHIDMYIYRPIQAHELEIFTTDIDLYGNEYNELFEKYSNVDVDYLKINNVDEYKENFYASDHHWNYRGSYLGYVDMLNMLDPELTPLEPTGIKCIEDQLFYGTHANFTGRVYGGDEMCVYTFDYADYTVYQNGEEIDDLNPNEFGIAETEESFGYLYNDVYQIGDTLPIYDTDRDELENVLVIGDSYMAPVARLLSSHFNETHFVNGTNYNSKMGHKFNYDEYLEDNDIDKIIFMYTLENYFYEDEWGAIYSNFDIIRNEVE